MPFLFAYTMTGDGANVIKDYPIDTTANFPVASQKKGILVKQVAGLMQPAGTGAAALPYVGVFEGQEFSGLVAQGQPYAAKNTSFTASITDTTNFPNGIAKVRTDKTSVYKVKGSVAAANTHVGNQYGITYAANDQTVNIADTTNKVVTVVAVDVPNNWLYVTLI